jgi:outer membrane lipoprotein-sorting protein|tara:strand:+ start:5021 stop:5602 length:582 start_codon:yes stop_codon:yes gene_type:complete
MANTAVSSDVDKILLEVEQNMSNIKTVQALFVQNKHMSMFDMPIIIKGKFYIENPHMFAWIVTEPVEYTLIITEDKIKKWDESNGTQEMSLKENPMFKEMISQITFWFSGAYASCKKDYHVKLISDEPCVLEFSPKEHNPASKMLSNVTLSFKEDKNYITKIQLFEKNGDSTELFFNDVKINTAIAQSAWELN